MKTSFSSLPTNAFDFMELPWERIEPFYEELIRRPLDASSVQTWLADWTRLSNLLSETYNRLEVATTVDTSDEDAQRRYENFLDEIFPSAQARDQALKQKLLDSGLQPEGFEIPLRNLRAESELFREANLPLLSQELKLTTEYDKIAGAQTFEWEGQEVTIYGMRRLLQDEDRARREAIWQRASDRQLADRQAMNDLWGRLLELRGRIAANADQPDFRAYQWKRMLRFDYTPEDCYRFHDAIEQVVVPAAERVYEKRRRRLGVERLRPWDLEVDPTGSPPLRPFEDGEELKATAETIFRQVDTNLGDYFKIMRDEGLLDLDNRKNKAPGGYCTDFDVVKRPFIFMNAVGIHDDVQTLLHEGGHAFHVFEAAHLPYHQQYRVGMEFAEVASMSMELLAAPYLSDGQGGFYPPEQAARARIEHLERSILFWPYMAVVDAFQHWVYLNPELAKDPANCDAKWGELWQRFMRGVDWSGLEEEMKTGWHRKPHIFQMPFYYVEYGLAQLGAFQVWRNALEDQHGAVAAYRRALSLGGTQPLPDLFAAAGAKFAFDPDTLGQAVDLAEKTIARLEGAG